jgi:hypothetical protein
MRRWSLRYRDILRTAGPDVNVTTALTALACLHAAELWRNGPCTHTGLIFPPGASFEADRLKAEEPGSVHIQPIRVSAAALSPALQTP